MKSYKSGVACMEKSLRCQARIDLDALRHNFLLAREKAAGAAVIAVVKADAYGHGDVVAAPLFDRLGADAFAVACLDEARRLRGAGIRKPVLILGFTPPEDAAALAAADAVQAVYSPAFASALSDAAVRAGVTVRAHFKLDTGMGRLGFAAVDGPAEAAAQMARAAALPGLRFEGAFTHFAAADGADADSRACTARQYALFTGTLRLASERGVALRVRHCCNSAGVFAWPEYHLDAVRPGIILYGEQPLAEAALPGLVPALRLCAAVAHVHTLAAGQTVGYGCTFRAGRPMRVATIAAGYADGYPRALSNCGTVSVRGRPARVLGRVCMDQIMADVTDIPGAAAGDTAILFGGGAADSTARAAQLAGTISYELLCGISRRVPRIYCENGQVVRILAPDDSFETQTKERFS